MSLLKETFVSLITNYSEDKVLIDKLWNEIELQYSNKKRYYHSLQHLDNLLIQIIEIKEFIQNWEVVLFSLYYHDIIYNSLKSDNEEKSADLAEKRMKEISVSQSLITLCKEQILATKSHQKSLNKDTNYFTDADLSILGQPWVVYFSYFKNVRKEYVIYPDFVYNPGRKKVLQQFLSMERIFKTDYFYNKYEWQAKQNIQKEIDLL